MSDDKSTTDDTANTDKPKTQKRPGATSQRQTAASRARQKGDGSSAERAAAIAAMLRTAAASIEGNPALAQALLRDLPGTGARIQPAPETASRRAGRRSRTSAQPSGSESSGTIPLDAGRAIDPFMILREQGQSGLRARLHVLDLEALRTVVRSHRLDPGRIASRWTDRERLVELIVEQVAARASLGRAFERV